MPVLFSRLAQLPDNPVLIFRREHELRQILAEMQPAALVAPPSFRRHEQVEMLESVPAAPLRWVSIERRPATPFGKVRKQELIEQLGEGD